MLSFGVVTYLVWITACARGGSPPSLEHALDAYSNGHTSAAQTELETLRQKNSSDPRISLYLGVIELALGDRTKARQSFAMGRTAAEAPAIQVKILAQAIESLAKDQNQEALELATLAETLGPLAEAHYTQATALWKLGNFSESRRVYLQLATDDTASPELRQQALKLSHRPNSANQFRLSADLAAGFNSNARATGQSLPSDFRGIRNLSATAGFSLLDYRFSLEDTAGFPEDRLVAHQLRSKVEIPFSEDWNLSVAVQLRHERFGAEPFLLRAGLEFQLEKNWGQWFGGIFSESIRNLALSENSRNFSGWSQLSRLYLGRGEASWIATLGVAHQRESSSPIRTGTAVLPLANTAYGPSFNLSWDALTHLNLESRTTYWFRFYDERAQPFDERRVDDFIVTTLQATYRTLTSTLKPYLSVTYLRNRSTLDALSAQDKNFQMWIAQIGLNWELRP